MNSTLLNGFYLATNNTIGPWSILDNPPTADQENNANIIRSFFLNEGWTLEAICGMLGCMQGESTINPAFIQATNRSRLPNAAASLTDVPNSVMQNFYREYYGDTRRAYAIGLIQWDGYSDRNGTPQQKLVAYAIENNANWWDGWLQLYRIRGEWQYDVNNNVHTFFNRVRVSGTYYDYTNYPTSTASPETLAAAWTYGVERNAGGAGFRDDNARYFYDWFTGPTAPGIINPVDFLLPLQADPVLPPFDPTDPEGPDTPVDDNYIPAWLLMGFPENNTRKGINVWIRV